jgi:hypothetical protein
MEMDKALKDDIANEFRQEYFTAEKKNESRFWKGFHAVNRFVDKALNKIWLDLPTTAFVSTALLFAVSPPAAALAFCVWGLDAGMALYSNIACRSRAEDKIWKDIESGMLPERYNDVLDSRIKGLSEKLELYTGQKAQLPAKGSIKTAFTNATAGATAEPAPAAVPAALPEAPKP